MDEQDRMKQRNMLFGQNEEETHKCIGNLNKHRLKDCPLLQNMKEVN